jgi:5-oxoprolinase (ATP-hydrolysing)
LRLFVRNGLFVVGPEIASAHPDPACYRKGGSLTVTHTNLFLGRLVVDEFPSIFGEDASQPLHVEVTKQKFHTLAPDLRNQTGQSLSPGEIALGFLDVANERMSRPIRNATEARGFSSDKHNLVSFGGAGGQHTCAIADELVIKRILIHKYSSILSAYGLSQAVLQAQSFEPYTGCFNLAALPHIRAKLDHHFL